MLRIQTVGTVTSVLDVVRDPAFLEDFDIFDSVLAQSQTCGRGQHRREWCSPVGNIYAALRLPMAEPFLGTEAAVALGTWLCSGLRELGYEAKLKWPNDIVLPIASLHGQEYAKVCGILLEEREHVLVAGIGINVVAAPEREQLRENTATTACCLQDWASKHGLVAPTAAELWKRLVKHVFSAYSDNSVLSNWHNLANSLLLWQGERVHYADGDEALIGVVRGVSSRGGLLFEAQGKIRHFLSGGIRPCC